MNSQNYNGRDTPSAPRSIPSCNPFQRHRVSDVAPAGADATRAKCSTDSTIPMVAQSMPVDNSHIEQLCGRQQVPPQPPRAPRIGSLPDPRTDFIIPMPQLTLPPSHDQLRRHRRRPDAEGAARVANICSSCPADYSFLRRRYKARSCSSCSSTLPSAASDTRLVQYSVVGVFIHSPLYPQYRR